MIVKSSTYLHSTCNGARTCRARQLYVTAKKSQRLFSAVGVHKTRDTARPPPSCSFDLLLSAHCVRNVYQRDTLSPTRWQRMESQKIIIFSSPDEGGTVIIPNEEKYYTYRIQDLNRRTLLMDTSSSTYDYRSTTPRLFSPSRYTYYFSQRMPDLSNAI